jgi:hypothetical protein
MYFKNILGGDLMGATEIVALVNSLLSIAFRLYESISQIQGNTPIPTWEELVDKNKLLQAKIDAEK